MRTYNEKVAPIRAPICRAVMAAFLASLAVLGAGCGFGTSNEFGATLPSGTRPAQWRLIWTETPQSRATVSWSTAAPGVIHQVYYDTRPHEGDLAAYRFKVESQSNGRYAGDDPELYYHHAILTDLEPSTTYYLRMVSDQSATREFHFVTAPDQDVPLKIFYGADSRTGREARRRINRMIAAMAGQDRSLLAFAHGGDYVWKNRDPKGLSRWSGWMTDHQLTVAADGRMLPIIPCRGDHEIPSLLYNQVFNWPGRGDRGNYFVTAVSPEVLLVTLDTNTSTSGDQAAFLEDALRENADLRWRLAQYHKPAYPGVKSRISSAKKDWVPLFEKYNLVMACEADGHIIKRTVPIRDDRMAPDGVVYIGEGGLGAHRRTPNTQRWYLQPPGKVGRGFHIQLLSFGRSSLKYEVILPGGKIFDDYEIKAGP